ncbi:MAG: flavin reductase [Eggerthellaceae bacterium]|nr:flavin reductase [Eggerthellaceae bacterium]
MLKSLGAKAAIIPCPVLIIGTYDEAGVPDAMNVAWGGQCGPKHVALNLSQHKTTENMAAKGCFTVAIADAANIAAADYVGIVSGAKVPDKIAKSGLSAVPAEKIDAPVFTEFPITMECVIVSSETDPATGELRVVGEIVNTQVDEKFVTTDGKVDAGGIEVLAFYGTDRGYYKVSGYAGQAWGEGKALM